MIRRISKEVVESYQASRANSTACLLTNSIYAANLFFLAYGRENLTLVVLKSHKTKRYGSDEFMQNLVIPNINWYRIST